MKTNRVLFLTTVLPGQQTCGGEVASQSFIDGLRQSGYQVSVVGYVRKNAEYKPKPYEIAVEERYIETSAAKGYAVLWMLLSFVLGLPYSAAKFYSQAYIKLVKSLLSAHHYDVVLIEHAQLSWLAKFVGAKAKIIFIAQNVEHEIYMSHSNSSANPLAKWLYAREAKVMEDLEAEISKRASEVWTLTKDDSYYFSRVRDGNNVKVLGVPPRPEGARDEVIEKRFDIGLIGRWTWKFNEEGLEWFFKFVYPELPSQLSIHVAGKGADWLEEKYPNVKYDGFVPDPQIFMAQAKVIALPMLGGSGIQIKTLDALASGSAIVATPTSMRGISLTSSLVKVAENPKDFAKLLCAEAHGWDAEKTEHAVRITSDWVQQRRQQFLDEIAKSISQTLPENAQTLPEKQMV
ncbi:MAG: glycosyltransferase [Cyanobacteria bacterium P01_D01_bin.56]